MGVAAQAWLVNQVTQNQSDFQALENRFYLDDARLLSPEIVVINFIKHRDLSGGKHLTSLKGHWTTAEEGLPTTFRVSIDAVYNKEPGNLVYYHCIPETLNKPHSGLVGDDLEIVYDPEQRKAYGYRIWSCKITQQIAKVIKAGVKIEDSPNHQLIQEASMEELIIWASCPLVVQSEGFTTHGYYCLSCQEKWGQAVATALRDVPDSQLEWRGFAVPESAPSAAAS